MEIASGAFVDGGNYQDYYEDDAFYIELKRQILQLTADDDTAEDFQETESTNNKVASLNRWSENGSDAWRVCGGTGVFIPPAKFGRRNKPNEGKKNDKSKMYKAVENLKENNSKRHFHGV